MLAKLKYVSMGSLSLISRPFKRRTPEKVDTIIYSLFIVHIIRTAYHAKPVNNHYCYATGCNGDPNACTCSVYQALSPAPPTQKERNDLVKGLH